MTNQFGVQRYKMVTKDMRSRFGDFTYEVGKSYSVNGNIEMCRNGFHSCLRAIDCLRYYNSQAGARLLLVETGDDCIVSYEKVVSRSIRVVREITGDEKDQLLTGTSCGEGWAVTATWSSLVEHDESCIKLDHIAGVPDGDWCEYPRVPVEPRTIETSCCDY